MFSIHLKKQKERAELHNSPTPYFVSLEYKIHFMGNVAQDTRQPRKTAALQERAVPSGPRWPCWRLIRVPFSRMLPQLSPTCHTHCTHLSLRLWPPIYLGCEGPDQRARALTPSLSPLTAWSWVPSPAPPHLVAQAEPHPCCPLSGLRFRGSLR